MPGTMTIPEIAERFGVSVETVRDRYVHQPDFPAPYLGIV
jgi:transposase